MNSLKKAAVAATAFLGVAAYNPVQAQTVGPAPGPGAPAAPAPIPQEPVQCIDGRMVNPHALAQQLLHNQISANVIDSLDPQTAFNVAVALWPVAQQDARYEGQWPAGDMAVNRLQREAAQDLVQTVGPVNQYNINPESAVTLDAEDQRIYMGAAQIFAGAGLAAAANTYAYAGDIDQRLMQVIQTPVCAPKTW